MSSPGDARSAEQAHSVGCVIWRRHGSWRTCICAKEAEPSEDQPAGFPGYDQSWLPPAAEAAERVLTFVSWFGDGLISDGQEPPLFARDLEAVAKAAHANPPASTPGEGTHV